MKFSGKEIPGSLFKLARDFMLSRQSFTPDDVRAHLLRHGAAALAETHGIPANHPIIANRVHQAACRELAQAGEVVQLKRGVWMKKSILDAAEASPPGTK